MEWQNVYVWALITSHPANAKNGCVCHRDLPNGHPAALHPYLDEKVYGPQAPLYVAWNPKCPWHGHDDPKGERAGQEVWIAAWEKKMEETREQSPNLSKFLKEFQWR